MLVTRHLSLVTAIMNFLERTLAGFLDAMDHALRAEALATARGLLQSLDPRVKVVGILALIIAAATAHKLWVIGAVFLVALLLAFSSRVSPLLLAKRVWIPVLLFTGIIALPAPFVIPGRVVWRLPGLGWPLTAQGVLSAEYLVTRVETAATLSVLLILSTPWTHVLKALRVLRVPVVVVVILGMAYRYIFLLLESARDMLESRRSRVVGALNGPDRRRLAASSVGVLMSKTLQLSGDVYSAMLARGFRGEVAMLDDFHTAAVDWIVLGLIAAIAAAAIYYGR
ncbi:MAG: cobalt ECF transporter T component CbiQ [Terriglobia bacterium]